jgi:hypothetical protein
MEGWSISHDDGRVSIHLTVLITQLSTETSRQGSLALLASSLVRDLQYDSSCHLARLQILNPRIQLFKFSLRDDRLVSLTTPF